MSLIIELIKTCMYMFLFTDIDGDNNNESPGYLQIQGVDLLASSNTKDHHTDLYDITQGQKPDLVVRRGQELNIKVITSRSFMPKEDHLMLVFKLGKYINILKNDNICITFK